MKRGMLNGTAVALGLLLAACGSGNEAAQNEAAAGDNATAMAVDLNNPFAQAEVRMNERMMAAVGSDAGDNWARKMIEHHQGAIDMSRIVLEQDATADVAAVARETIDKQQQDIEDFRKLLKDGPPDQQSAELYRPAVADMQQKMMAAKGADVSETFMRKMLEHHRGGVAMSDVALRNGVSGALREQVQTTRDDQQKDAEMIEAMLAGQSHQQAMAASGAKSAEPAPAEKPRTAPRAAPKSAPRAEPKAPPAAAPTAEPKAPTAACTAEHRAAGHC